MGEGEHVGQVVEHQEAEEAETKPGPAQPDGEEEGGKGEHVDDRVQREHLGQERLCCHQPEQEEQEEDDTKGKVNLESDVVLPAYALLHQGPRGVDDEDDHGGDVATELEDYQHSAAERLPRYQSGRPFFHLGYK